MSSLDWKDPFQRFQGGQLQVMVRPGEIIIENNIFIGSSNSPISPRIVRSENDSQLISDAGSLTIRINYFSHSRGSLFSYIHNYPENYDTVFRIDNNFFGAPVMQRDEVDSSSSAEDFFFQTKFNKGNALIFTNNTFEGNNRGYESLNSGYNGSIDNLQASGNVNASVSAPKFNDSSLPQDFDYRKIEIWSDCSVVYDNKAIDYKIDDIVNLHGKFYQLTKALTNGYNCSYEYWKACVEDPEDVYTARTYAIGTIIDTGGERYFSINRRT